MKYIKHFAVFFSIAVLLACHEESGNAERIVPAEVPKSAAVTEETAKDPDLSETDLFKETWHEIRHDEENGDYVPSFCDAKNEALHFTKKNDTMQVLFGMGQEDRLLIIKEMKMLDAKSGELICFEAYGDSTEIAVKLRVSYGKLYWSSPFNNETTAFVPKSQLKDYPVRKQPCE